MKRILAALFLIVLVFGGSQLDAGKRPTPRRFALLIDEQHGADADALKRLLVSDFGYEANAITIVTDGNATGAGIREAIFKLVSRAASSDSIFLLVALRTHYGQDGLTMLPSDANADQPWTAIRPEEVIKSLGEQRNGFMILPYCTPGGSYFAQSASRPVYWPFENLSAVAVCPQRPSAPADMSLTRVLLDGLRSANDNEISGDQLADFIARKGENLTAQLLSVGHYASTSVVFVRQKDRVAVLGSQLQQANTATEKVAIIGQLSDEVAAVSPDRRAAWTASAGKLLVAQLDAPNPDPNVQLEAARAIARIQYGPGINTLEKAVDSSPESLRGELASVVGQFPPEQALPVIERFLTNSSPTVRAGGLRALVDNQKEKSIPRTQKLLQTETVQEVVVIALQMLGKSPTSDPASLQAVSARMTDPRPAIRSEAMATLAILSPDAARTPLLAQLTNDTDPLVRERAAYTAGRYYRSDSQMESVLLQVLRSDSQDSLRRAAAWALGRMRSIAAENELTHWLIRDDADTLMRTTAAEALGSIGSQKSVVQLIDILNGQHHADIDLQIAAAAALGQIGDARALDPLLNALKSTDYGLRSAALGSVSQIQAGVAQSLYTHIHDPSPEVRAAAVAKIRPDTRRTTLQLIDALADSSSRVQDAAVKALSQDPCSECREVIAQQINQLTSPAAKVGLLRAIQAIHDPQLSMSALSLAADQDSGVRLEATRLASQFPGDQTLAIVMKAADDSDVYVRATAASSLARFQTPSADDKLKQLTRDRSAIVREAAVESLVSPKQQD